MGERAFTYYQFGLEATPGSPVAATRVLGADPKAVPSDRAWEAVRLGTGRRADTTHKRNDTLLVRDSLTFAQGYFQALPMLFQCSLDGTITPAEQTASQADYLWAVAPSMSAANAPDTVTLEMGDDVQAYEIEWVQFENLKFSGTLPQGGESAPVSIEAAYFGRQVTPTTFTASQSLHSGLEFLNAKFSRLYLDTAWAGVGTTEIPSTLRGFELEIITGTKPKFFGSANKYFDNDAEGMMGFMLTLTLEGNASADSIYDLYRAGTERAVSLQINGSQIGTGTSYNFTFNGYGYFEVVRPIDSESAGNNLHVAVFHGKEDASGNLLAANVTTNHNAV